MLFIWSLEILFVSGLVYGAFTQILIPVYNGTVLFPYFRKRAVLEQKIRIAKEERDEKNLKEEAEKIKKSK